MLGLYVVLAVVVLGLVIGVITSLKFERDIVRRKREEENARIKEELSKQEKKACATNGRRRNTDHRSER